MKRKRIAIIGVIFLAVVCLLVALFNSTFALFANEKYADNYIEYSTGLLSISVNSKTDNISLDNALPMTDDDGIQSTPYVFSIENIGNVDYKFNIQLLSTGAVETSFLPQYIRLQIDDGDVISLSDLVNGFIRENVVLKVGETMEVSVRIWLDYETPNTELGKSFNSKIVIDGQAVSTDTNYATGSLLTDHIKNLYVSNYDSSKNTAFADGTGMNYYAPSVNLMNDGLNSTGVMVSSDSAVDGTAGNIRYYGADPNNYIDIGDVYAGLTEIDNYNNNIFHWSELADRDACYSYFDCSINYKKIGDIRNLTFTDEASCISGLKDYYHVSSVDELCGITTRNAGDRKLYRIIGLFKDIELEDGTKKDLVKVIQDDSLDGLFAWDIGKFSQDNGVVNIERMWENNWHNASLNNILNNAYYNSGEVTHGYELRGFNVSKLVTSDFTKNGLNNSVLNKIETVKWNLGGWKANSFIYSNQIYTYERGNNSHHDVMWTGRIALMYPSDYAYATDFNVCENTPLDYHLNGSCFGNDWLFSLSRTTELTLSPSGIENDNHTISNILLARGSAFTNVNYSNIVRPSFYLDADLLIMSGDGSKDNPYTVR